MGINEYTAKQCSEDERFNEIIAFKITGLTDVPKKDQVGVYRFLYDGEWILFDFKNPVCMVVVEEVFELETERAGGDEWYSQPLRGKSWGRADTPHLARIACIEAIHAESER